MRNDPDTLKTRLDRSSDAFGLTQEYRDLTLRQVFGSQQSPDDPTVILAVTANYALQVTKPLTETIEALPGRIDEASKKAVGSVAKAATARVEEAHARLAENVGEAVAEAAMVHFNDASRKRDLGIGIKLLGVTTAVALVAGIAGWAARGSANVATAAQFTALAQRSDAASWALLASANPDLNASLRHYCGPGSDRVRTLNGARFCDVALWLEGAPAPAASSTAVGVYYSVIDKLAAWGPLWLIGAGLLAGLLGRKVLRATFSWRPLKWLID